MHEATVTLHVLLALAAMAAILADMPWGAGGQQLQEGGGPGVI